MASSITVVEQQPAFVLVGRDDANRACVIMYQINENVWSAIQDMGLTLETKPGVGYYQGNVYMLGGEDINGCKLCDGFAYNIYSKNVVQLTDLRIARSEAIIFGAKGHIYVTGGLGRYAFNGLSHMEYLENSNCLTWKNAPPMHRHRNEKAAICSSGDRVYVIGGGSQVCEYFDVVKRSWHVVGTLPDTELTELDDHSPFLAAANGFIFILGYFKPSKLLMLDTATFSWSYYVPKNDPPETVSCAVGFANKVYVLDNYKRIMTLNTDTGYWSLLTKIPRHMVHPVFLTCTNE